MNYIGLNTCDMSNGDGIRVSIFVSGCTLHCKGCFNKESWDFNAGLPYTSETENRILKALEDTHVKGLSILGGEPLEPTNLPIVTKLCKRVKDTFGDTKDIWLWTGHTPTQVHANAGPILDYVNVIIAGPFIEHLKGNYKYYGSRNQKCIWLHSVGASEQA